MNVKDMAKRYQMSEKDVRSFLKENFIEMNAEAEHVKAVKRDWQVDEAGIAFMDKQLNYKPNVQPAKEEKVDISLDEAKKQIELLITQKTALQKELNQIISSHQKLQSDYSSLQNSFLSLQEGKESMNTNMIREYKQLSERLTTDLNNMRQRCEALQQSKEQQYEELQARINEMQDELVEKTDVMKEKLASDHKALEAKKLSDKLYKQLAEAQRTIDKLTAKLQKSELDYSAIQNKLEEYKNQASQVFKTLMTAQIQCQAICDSEIELLADTTANEKGNSEDTTENKDTKKKSEKKKEGKKESSPDLLNQELPTTKKEAAPYRKNETPSKPATEKNDKIVVRHLGRDVSRTGKEQLNSHQQSELDKIRVENAQEDEKEKKGLYDSIRQSVASFLGFM
ncbi:hypothetical protein [Selenomonas ruminantium]|uniref:hypothetical protein n=1 Tax=Selenomonas ruminantium TaxID=971 RepID=UPI0026F1DBF9|nr:hypothetical protein [Selenomonas ruminantium]